MEAKKSPEIKKADTGDAAKKSNALAKKPPKRKVCVFCVEKVQHIDYKEANKLRRFVTEKGKMLPRRMSGTCAKHQRVLAVAIKNARIMALLPFKAE